MRSAIFNGHFWLGDCLELMRDIPDGSVDMVITSPPYDNIRTYNDSLEWSFDVFKSVACELSRVIKSGGVIVWNVADATVDGSETGTSFRQALYFKDECGLNIHDTMIFHREKQPKDNGIRYEQHFEYMFVLTKGKRAKSELLREPCVQAGTRKSRTSRDNHKEQLTKSTFLVSETKIRGNIWKYQAGGHIASNTNWHPATFPLQLATDHILSWSRPTDVVLDPFGGSGTTAIAAMNTNRKWICIEKNPFYYYNACIRACMWRA